MNSWKSPATIAAAVLLILTQAFSQDSWKSTEEAAAKASSVSQFGEAERLLAQNLKLVQTLPAKDARRPRTMFDLAEIYRAEGKYNEALPLYESASQIYNGLYGPESTEIAD